MKKHVLDFEKGETFGHKQAIEKSQNKSQVTEQISLLLELPLVLLRILYLMRQDTKM